MRIWVMTQEYSSHIIGGLGVVATRLSKCLGDIPGMDVVVLTTGKKMFQYDVGQSRGYT